MSPVSAKPTTEDPARAVVVPAAGRSTADSALPTKGRRRSVWPPNRSPSPRRAIPATANPVKGRVPTPGSADRGAVPRARVVAVGAGARDVTVIVVPRRALDLVLGLVALGLLATHDSGVGGGGRRGRWGAGGGGRRLSRLGSGGRRRLLGGGRRRRRLLGGGRGRRRHGGAGRRRLLGGGRRPDRDGGRARRRDGRGPDARLSRGPERAGHVRGGMPPATMAMTMAMIFPDLRTQTPGRGCGHRTPGPRAHRFTTRKRRRLGCRAGAVTIKRLHGGLPAPGLQRHSP